MTDPTPAPARTDEQIEAALEEVRDAFYINGAWTDPDARFATVIAAVVARAKREAAEEIAQAIETKRDGDRTVDARITGPTPEYRVGHADGLTNAAVLARGIGGL